MNREKVKGEEDSNKAIVDEYNKKCKERDRICDSISKGERDIMDLEYKISFLEEKINSFLSDNDYELFDIKYQINSFAFGEEQIYSFSALLLLKK